MSFKQSIAALIVLFSVSFSAYADKIVYVEAKPTAKTAAKPPIKYDVASILVICV